MSIYVKSMRKMRKMRKQLLFFLLGDGQIIVESHHFSFFDKFELFFLLGSAQITVYSYRFSVFCDFSLAHFQVFFSY